MKHLRLLVQYFRPNQMGYYYQLKKILINFDLSTILEKPDKKLIELKKPFFVYPKSPLRIQIQNKTPIVNFYKIHFVFKFNNIEIRKPDLFFNSDSTYSG